MDILKNEKYLEDIKYVTNLEVSWKKFENKSILISGASGLIGSCLIDIIMSKNFEDNLNCTIYALSRNEKRAKERFKSYLTTSLFKIICQDINKPLDEKEREIDYIFHLASNTHPKTYAEDPIGTITTNIIGTQNMLEFAIKNHSTRVIFTSSCEIYGENRGDVEEFEEDYCGYINSNTLRAGYPESKRCGEALCQAYIKQKDLDIVILRLPRVYGPTMLMSNTMAISQFIKQGIKRENIILKSTGTQYFSYIYVLDAVSALLTVLLSGKCGEAYNVADDKSNIKLKDLATIIANFSSTRVIFDIPDEIEKEGFSKATKAIMTNKKLQVLGWKAKYDIKQGIERTISILK